MQHNDLLLKQHTRIIGSITTTASFKQPSSSSNNYGFTYNASTVKELLPTNILDLIMLVNVRTIGSMGG